MKKIFNFALYDFANSAFTTIVITFIFATYFAKQIAPNPVMGQSYWGWTIGITGFLVAIIGPIVGSFADKKNKVVFFVRCFSLLCIIFTTFLWFSKPSQSFLLYTLIIVGIANLFYELSLIFYNSLLKDISINKNLGKSSGFGFALGYIGGIIILLISIKLFIDTDNLPFGLTKEESENIRAIALLVSIWFLLFSIPFLFFTIKERKTKKSSPIYFNDLKKLLWNKKITVLGKFLLARMISSTVGNFMAKDGTRILMYHSLNSDVEGDIYRIYRTEKSIFRQQMKWLNNTTHSTVCGIQDAANKNKAVVITFDDGYLDTLQIAAPILAEYKMPFTVFVSPDLIQSGDSRYLDKKSLLELSKYKGCTIGAHGYSHCRLTNCNDEELEKELTDSKKWLSDLLMISVDTMSYPHGAVDQRVRDSAQSAGYKIATCSRPGINLNGSDPLLLKRTDNWSFDTINTFKQKVYGQWDWIQYLYN